MLTIVITIIIIFFITNGSYSIATQCCSDKVTGGGGCDDVAAHRTRWSQACCRICWSSSSRCPTPCLPR